MMINFIKKLFKKDEDVVMMSSGAGGHPLPKAQDVNIISAVPIDVILGTLVDSSSKLQISDSIPVGEYKLTNDELTMFFDNETSGTGSITYDSSLNSKSLDVTSNADYAITQTKQFHSYFPGHTQQIQITFIGFTPQTNVTKRLGYFSSATTGSFNTSIDGLYLESSGGTVSFVVSKDGTATTYAIANWEDSLDGNGASGVTIDWDNFQVFEIEFLYLGGASIKLNYLYNGQKYTVLTHQHINLVADTFIGHPNQPIRAEIRSSGGSGSFDFTCAHVATLGSNIEYAGLPLSVSTGESSISAGTAGTEYVLLGVRKKAAYRNVELFIQEIEIASAGGVNDLYAWRLSINPTLSGGLTYSDTGISLTGFERAISGGETVTVNTGVTIAKGVGSGRSSGSLSITKNLRIGQTVDGVMDQLIFSITPLANNQSIAGSINATAV